MFTNKALDVLLPDKITDTKKDSDCIDEKGTESNEFLEV